MLYLRRTTIRWAPILFTDREPLHVAWVMTVAGYVSYSVASYARRGLPSKPLMPQKTPQLSP